MKVGDLVVHVDAKPYRYRVRMVCGFEQICSKTSLNNLIADKEMILFADGGKDWKDHWKVFKGWVGYEGR